jgi:hypothetical protein
LVFHILRRGYGWTDGVIVSHIEAYGSQWVIDTCKRLLEDEASDKRWLINVAQAAMTPMDKKSSKGLRRYVAKLHKMVDSFIPWRGDAKVNRLKALKEKGTSGEDALKESEEFARKLGMV